MDPCTSGVIFKPLKSKLFGSTAMVCLSGNGKQSSSQLYPGLEGREKAVAQTEVREPKADRILVLCQALGKSCLYFFCDLKGNNPLFPFTGDLFTPDENTGCYYDVKWDVCMWLNNCSFQHSLLLELLAWLQPAGALWMGIRP